LFGDFDGAIRGPSVDDDDLVDKGPDAFQAVGQNPLLVFHDHAQRDICFLAEASHFGEELFGLALLIEGDEPGRTGEPGQVGRKSGFQVQAPLLPELLTVFGEQPG